MNEPERTWIGECIVSLDVPELSEHKLDKLAAKHQYDEQKLLQALYEEGEKLKAAQDELSKKAKYNSLVARIKAYMYE
jgi:hypothetical protein